MIGDLPDNLFLIVVSCATDHSGEPRLAARAALIVERVADSLQVGYWKRNCLKTMIIAVMKSITRRMSRRLKKLSKL